MKKKSYNFDTAVCSIYFTDKNSIFNELDFSAGLMVFDKNTRPLFDEAAGDDCLVLKPGEKHKTLKNMEKIIAAALEKGFGRDSVFIACGGGVICDMTAFAASVYMRGARLVLVPTTLLSMIDASFGGKTGVDYKQYKNIIGTFYPAERISICTDFLQKLPEAEILNGLAEAVKHAMLGDEQLLVLLEKNRDKILARDTELLQEIVERSIAVKAAIVEQDLRESGVRMHLNLGHTFAHALETVTGFKNWPHGRAVAWGLGRALTAGRMLGLTDRNYADRIIALLELYGYRLNAEKIKPELLAAAMANDKKKRGGEVNFVLQKTLAGTFIQKLEKEFVLEVLAETVS
jgi:3-dehydroquinate synthase